MKQARASSTVLLNSTMRSLKLGSCNSLAVFEPAISTSQPLTSSERRLHSSWRCPAIFSETPAQTRRLFLIGTTFLTPLSFQWAHAEEKPSSENDEGLLGGLLTLFDPNEKTKSGRILPKIYLKNAREVVKNLRESLKEDSKDNAKFRRSADSAKESIKEFMRNWTGQKSVASEDSYTALVRAIRVLADFYSKKGPTAALSEDIKSKIMDNLNSAEAAL